MQLLPIMASWQLHGFRSCSTLSKTPMTNITNSPVIPDFIITGHLTKLCIILFAKHGHNPLGVHVFFHIQHKLSRIKEHLKQWSKVTYGQTNNKLIHNDDKIKEIEQRIWDQPFDPIFQQHLSRLIIQREKLMLLLVTARRPQL